MKYRLLFYLVLILLPGSPGYGQSEQGDAPEWAPVGAKWWYTYSGFYDGNFYLTMESTGDTLVSGFPCRILEIKEHYPDHYTAETYFENTYMKNMGFSDSKIILRQEGDSVFYLRKDRFELLYDFSLKTGDTMSMAEPRLLPPYRPRDTIVSFEIAETYTTTIDGQELRVQGRKELYPEKLGEGSPFRGGYEVIEKIGDMRFILPVDDVECDAFCPLGLRCYQDESIFYKVGEEACDTLFLFGPPSYTQSADTESWTIFPNPVSSDAAQIQVKGIRAEHWILRDIHGRILYRDESVSGSSSLDIPVHLAPGMYLLELRSGRERAVKKLLVK